MTLFRLDASILPATSASRELGDLVESEWTAAHPDSSVVRRDLSADPVPATAWRDAVQGGFTPEADRTDAQREAIALARTFADELRGADALLFTVPLYNYGVSQHFKTWFDLASIPRARICAASPRRWSPSSAETTTRAHPRRAGTTPPPGCAACSRTCGASICGSSTARSPSWA